MAQHVESGELDELIGSLQTLLLSTEDLQGFLDQVTQLACRVVVPPASCGITTRHRGSPTTIAHSDERALLIDEDQYGAGSGPCLHALDTGELVEITDQSRDHRWEEYRKHAVERGVRSALAVPLTIPGADGEPGEVLGALNVYGYDRADSFGEDEKRRVEVFAAQAATALRLTMRHVEQSTYAQQLETALASRSTIDQAMGILMAQQRCDAEAAFDLLRRHSQNTNRPLREVAADLVRRISTGEGEQA